MPEDRIFSSFDVSFRCYFPDNGTCNHFQSLRLVDIPTWIDCYKFTHPNCKSISVKVWFTDTDL